MIALRFRKQARYSNILSFTLQVPQAIKTLPATVEVERGFGKRGQCPFDPSSSPLPFGEQGRGGSCNDMSLRSSSGCSLSFHPSPTKLWRRRQNAITLWPPRNIRGSLLCTTGDWQGPPSRVYSKMTRRFVSALLAQLWDEPTTMARKAQQRGTIAFLCNLGSSCVSLQRRLLADDCGCSLVILGTCPTTSPRDLDLGT